MPRSKMFGDTLHIRLEPEDWDLIRQVEVVQREGMSAASRLLFHKGYARLQYEGFFDGPPDGATETVAAREPE